ncbi:glycosyltransferase family 4 protein [Terrabacter carboxydivorans]|uniref:glycosyltransferase family 4 protein n=1 Tax=Terrabacter carboxydivorans TaxID=619730 RepID=UPI0031CFAFD2
MTARHSRTLVLATVGAEAAVTARLAKLLNRRLHVVVFDVLAPRRELPRPLARRLFASVDEFVVIRTGDATMLARRFDVDPGRCRFVRWPVPDPTGPGDGAPDPAVGESAGRGLPSTYVYSAGWAHRDWDTLVQAIDQTKTEVQAVIAPGRPLSLPPGVRDRVRVIDMPPPELGRVLTRDAEVVAVVMHDTDLPAGPLVLLDAMAAGRAVVATDVNGTRDYVRDGETALVVPAGDPAALAGALSRVWEDPELRARLGSSARRAVTDLHQVTTFWDDLLAPGAWESSTAP